MKNWAQQELTREQAIAFHDSGIWMNWSNEQVVKFQLFQMRLCMSQSRFHQALETVLGRRVDTYEYGRYYDDLCKEFLGTSPAPTVDDIMTMVPFEHHSIFQAQQQLQEVA